MKTSLVLLLVVAVLVMDTEAGKCNKKRKKAIKKGKWAPECDGKAYLPRQCDTSLSPPVCWCVNTNKGKPLKGAFKRFQIPIDESYNCTKEPTECYKERFEAMIQGISDVPRCDDSGNYMQCQKLPGTTNIAMNRATFQMDMGWNGASSRAVDGNGDGSYWSHSCTHTLNHPEAWWAVDLGEETEITSVSISNRADCCSNRLANFQIGTTNVSPDTTAPAVGSYDACAHSDGALGAGETKSFDCAAKGRYVIVQLKGSNYLTLCEVQVFGVLDTCETPCWKEKDTTNLAMNKPTFQMDMGWNGESSRAVDGNGDGSYWSLSCTHTLNHPEAWWAVDLGEETEISAVSISNRADCCSNRLANFQIGTTNVNPDTTAPAVGSYDACAHSDGALGAGETRSFDCAAKGRYVVVQLKGSNYLTLCEVQVFGDVEVCAAGVQFF